MHIGLHLRVVLGLCFFHALVANVLKALLVVRLLLAHMRRLGRLDQTLDHAIE